MPVRAIVAGHLCLDITPRFLSGGLPGPGQLAVVGPATLSTGGAVSNSGLSLLRLGVETSLCGKVGDDVFGRAVCDVLERHTPGSSAGIIVSPEDSTSYSLVLSPPGQDRAFVHSPGANDTFGLDDIPQALLERAALLHHGYPALMRRMYLDGGRELEALFARARQAGLVTSLDLCYVDPASEAGQADWPAILRRVLPLVDIFAPSLDELRAVWDESESKRRQSVAEAVPRLAEKALAAGAWIVVIKAGTHGVYMRSSDRGPHGWRVPLDHSLWAVRELWAPAFVPARVVTTTGAGDAAVAGFLAALLRGDWAEGGVTMACAAGASCCEQADATSGVRPWDETWARMRAGWAQAPLSQPGPGWWWGARDHVWRGPHHA